MSTENRRLERADPSWSAGRPVTRLRFGLMWLAAVLADAAGVLAAVTEQLYRAAARGWWRHHPHREAVTGRVALPKWIEL